MSQSVEQANQSVAFEQTPYLQVTERKKHSPVLLALFYNYEILFTGYNNQRELGIPLVGRYVSHDDNLRGKRQNRRETGNREEVRATLLVFRASIAHL